MRGHLRLLRLAGWIDVNAPDPRWSCCDHTVPSGPEDADIECCLCTDRPCEKVSVVFASAHGWSWSWAQSDWRQQAVQYAIEHGHVEPGPWDEPGCPPGCRYRG